MTRRGRSVLNGATRTARAVLDRLPLLAARVPPRTTITIMALCSLYLAYRHAYPCADARPDDGEVWRKACYNDIQPLYSGRGLSEGLRPYLEHDVEYPVLIGLFMGVVGLPIQALGASGRLATILNTLGFETVDEGLVFFWVTAAVLAVLALVTTWGLLLCRRDRPWDIALWAAAPALILHSTINWDLLAVSLTVLGLAAWSRGSPGWAGVFLGLGTAAKLYPLVILGPLIILCLRAGTPASRLAAVRLVTASATAWLAVNLPIMIMNPGGWAYAYRFSQQRWIDWGSLWFTLDQISGGIGLAGVVRPLLGTVPALNRSSLLLFALCCVGIAALIWYAPQRPRVAAMAFLVVGAFLLTNKVWSPQFVLWLLPLAVLARPRWGWFLLWQVAEVTYLFSVMRAVLGERDGYALVQASGLRWTAVAILCGLVVREALQPERDVVLADGDDPEGGILNRADRGRGQPVREPAHGERPDSEPAHGEPTGGERHPEPAGAGHLDAPGLENPGLDTPGPARPPAPTRRSLRGRASKNRQVPRPSPY